jgi:hypothetical protein
MNTERMLDVFDSQGLAVESESHTEVQNLCLDSQSASN